MLDAEFVEEYSQLHITLDDIISLPQTCAQLGPADDNFTAVKPEAIPFPGIQDGLSFNIHITNYKCSKRHPL